MADANHCRRFFAEGSQSLNHMLVGLGKVPAATALEALAAAARGIGGAFGAAVMDCAPAAERDVWRDRILLELLHGAGDVIASEIGKGKEP